MKLDFRRYELRLAYPWAVARTRAAETQPVVLLRLRDGDGTVGWGEASPIARYGESVESVECFLSNVNAASLSFGNIAESLESLPAVAGRTSAAKCALSTALLDGASKRSGLSLCDFLGLRFSEQRYTTSLTIGIDTPATIRKKVQAASSFPILKMKMGSPDDRSNLAALREVAPAKPVRVDANEGWATKEEALRSLEFLAHDAHIEFVEQPLPAASSARDWVWLKERSPLPIFADESYHLAADAPLAAECFHGVNVKLVKTGGIAGAVEALQAARKKGLKTMLGCMIESSLLVTAAAHLAELCDYLDLDGNLLITNDPFKGITATNGVLSFANTPEKFGIRAAPHAW